MDAAGAKLMTPSWAQNNPATAKPRIIDPAAGFTTQLYAALYGLAGFPASFDQSFVESSRIFVVGNGEAPVPDAALMPTPGTAGAEATYNPAELVSADKPGAKGWILWRDKTSGKTYAAKARPRTTHEGGTTPYRTDIGARMLENAANLEKMADAACAGGASSSCTYRTRILENFRDNVEIMRMLHKMLGN
jgi:hypothetical protein